MYRKQLFLVVVVVVLHVAVDDVLRCIQNIQLTKNTHSLCLSHSKHTKASRLRGCVDIEKVFEKECEGKWKDVLVVLSS